MFWICFSGYCIAILFYNDTRSEPFFMKYCLSKTPLQFNKNNKYWKRRYSIRFIKLIIKYVYKIYIIHLKISMMFKTKKNLTLWSTFVSQSFFLVLKKNIFTQTFLRKCSVKRFRNTLKKVCFIAYFVVIISGKMYGKTSFPNPYKNYFHCDYYPS